MSRLIVGCWKKTEWCQKGTAWCWMGPAGFWKWGVALQDAERGLQGFGSRGWPCRVLREDWRCR